MWDTWCVGGPRGCAYSASSKGWMEEEHFHNWFVNVFFPHAKKTAPGKHLLIVDGHVSHLGLRTLNYAAAQDIILLSLLPHSSHILQPLDVGVYGPYKRAWRDIMQDYYRDNFYKQIDNCDFPKPNS